MDWVDLFETAPISESLNHARPALTSSAAAYADAVEALIEAQWSKELFSDIPPDTEAGAPFEAYIRIKRPRIEPSRKPRYTSLPFAMWRNWLDRLWRVKHGRKALIPYDQLYDEFAFIDGFLLDPTGTADPMAEEAL
ncbi:hypothetical protein H3V53_36930 [Paraburkholderia bengalensis]|uniref:Transposase n=1 Tax=Paraburkholderia bengalensis TaxID=2747562 RepID=A0ABU8J467_9BURK